MGIDAVVCGYNNNTSGSATGKKGLRKLNATGENFEIKPFSANDKKCPYSILAKDGVIQYNGVTFGCDYTQNAITLGDMSEKDKILRIALPSGGSLHLNVDNIDSLSKAADMFTPEDLNAIMRAIHEYNHCTRKRHEIEEEKAKPIDEVAEENESPDAEKKSEIEEKALISQLNAYHLEQYHKLMLN